MRLSLCDKPLADTKGVWALGTPGGPSLQSGWIMTETLRLLFWRLTSSFADSFIPALGNLLFILLHSPCAHLGGLVTSPSPEDACCTLSLGRLFPGLLDFVKQTEAKNNKSTFHLCKRAGRLCARFSFFYMIFLPF